MRTLSIAYCRPPHFRILAGSLTASVTHFSPQYKSFQAQTGLLNTLMIDPGMIGRPVTLATTHLLVSSYHYKKMLETERKREADRLTGGQTDSEDGQGDRRARLVSQLVYKPGV